MPSSHRGDQRELRRAYHLRISEIVQAVLKKVAPPLRTFPVGVNSRREKLLTGGLFFRRRFQIDPLVNSGRIRVFQYESLSQRCCENYFRRNRFTNSGHAHMSGLDRSRGGKVLDLPLSLFERLLLSFRLRSPRGSCPLCEKWW